VLIGKERHFGLGLCRPLQQMPKEARDHG
jgi:hypothetical protein